MTATPDAGTGGEPGGGDGGGGGTGTTLVQLTVLSTAFDGQPDTGAIAVFQDPSGATIAGGLVDAAGHAQADLPAGGSITVIRVVDSSDTERDVAMTTIRGVRPGDPITVGTTRSPAYYTGGSSTMTASFTPIGANYSYAFYTACGGTGGSGGTTQLAFIDGCHGATFDLLAVATSTTDPPDVRYVYQTDLAYLANGSVTVPNTWTEASTFTATLNNVPANLGDLELTHTTLLGKIGAAPITAGVTAPSPGVVAAITSYPPGVGAGAIAALALHDNNASGFQTLEVRTPAVAATLGIDLAQQALPWLVGAPVGTLTGASWDQLEGGTPDVRLVTWNGHWTDGARTVFVNWTLEDGEHATSVTLPALPAMYAAYDPGKAAGVVVGRPSVLYLDYDALDGYDAARRYGPNLGDSLTDLGVLTDRPLVRRLSRTPLTR
ncbi:MAG TPA: hypothetical protein VHW23_15790 [Kofleriaceae bacterium]|nr:hypothetical protein [Kofleriaceae bacterium]